jgi:hypothetical protein
MIASRLLNDRPKEAAAGRASQSLLALSLSIGIDLDAAVFPFFETFLASKSSAISFSMYEVSDQCSAAGAFSAAAFMAGLSRKLTCAVFNSGM